MRLALIAPLVTPIGDLHLGGAQAVVADLARALAARGHDVTVYAARGSAIPGVTVADVGVDAQTLRADLFHAGAERTGSPAMTEAYRAVYADVARGGFDVVHNHGFDVPAVSIAAQMGIPVLHTLHLPPSHAVAAAVDEARSHGPVWCAAVSQAHATAWSALITVDAILRNGVPVDEIPFRAEADGPALVAARFSPEKGIDDAIAAAQEAGHPIDVYGTPYNATYEATIRERWAGDPSVSFHDPVPRTALWKALGKASAVLCLSQWDEPFGMVAAEAQAVRHPGRGNKVRRPPRGRARRRHGLPGAAGGCRTPRRQRLPTSRSSRVQRAAAMRAQRSTSARSRRSTSGSMTTSAMSTDAGEGNCREESMPQQRGDPLGEAELAPKRPRGRERSESSPPQPRLLSTPGTRRYADKQGVRGW